MVNVIKMRPSHVPVLKACVEVLNPQSVIECGVGLNSTPILAKVPNYLGIEHDVNWMMEVKNAAPSLNVVLISMPDGLRYNTYPARLTDQQRGEVLKKYETCAGYTPCTDLLFIDTWAGSRWAALRALWKKFGVCVIHDTQNSGYWYEETIKEMVKVSDLWCAMSCKPVVKKEPWTTMLFRFGDDAAKIPAIKESILKHSKYGFKFNTREMR